jgi:hypothetical protein
MAFERCPEKFATINKRTESKNFMSEHSRYEKTDRQFNDLPIPDEEASWQKMKEILDDDDDTIVPPPMFLKSCLGWAILLAGLVAAWLIVRPGKWATENSKTEQVSSSNKIQNKPVEQNSGEEAITHLQQNNRKESVAEKTNPSNLINESVSTKLKQTEKLNVVTPQSSFKTKGKDLINKASSKNSKPVRERKQIAAAMPIDKTVRKKIPAKKQSTEIIITEKTQNADPVNPFIAQASDNLNNSQVTGQENNLTKTDTLSITNKQAPATPDTLKTKANSKTEKKIKQKKLLVAAGLGEQFLIPIAGQTTVPYSRYGRRSSLADYVPSFFVSLQKETRWFVQTEFRYGAAQSVKEISYNQKTRYDVISSNVTTTTMRLKKTYYHQLPASFNYYVRSNVSIGIGGMYSHFYGAVTEKEITTLNTQTQTTSTFKEIIPVKHFTDSFLYKTQVHALVQADYHWKKFSFGLRYTKDIQPYIRFTKPDGTVDEEKNQSLQFIVRYRFWQSHKL